MIGLVLAMLRARLGRALTALALAVVAVAAAVAGPAFLAAADRAVIADELSEATAREQTVTARASVDLVQGRDRIFESTAPALLTVPGLTPVFAAEFDAYLEGPSAGGTPRLVFREGVCGHLRIVQGRCPIGTNEIILGEPTAALLGIHSGQTVVERESIETSDGPAAVDPPAVLSVVGIFQVPDPHDLYWADQHYFDGDTGGLSSTGVSEPAFASRGTLEALSHRAERQSVDALLDPATLTPANLPRLAANLHAAQSRANLGRISDSSGIPALLGRIDADRAALREVVPLAAVPLVILAWLVMLLAAGYATEARRAEVGLLKLRGTGVFSRWWLVLGESLLAIVVGSVLGYLVGYAVVAVAAHALLTGAGPVAPSWQPLRWAAVAVLGTLIATVLATRRPFAAPVTDLLRQVPPRGSGWRGLALEAMLYPLAVVAVLQMRAEPHRLTGVELLAPGLVVLAVALLAARLVGPVAGWVGGRALRAGRLGPALGALRLSRRPGSARLLMLLVVAVAQLAFAVTAFGVATRAGVQRAQVEQGAPTVLDVLPVDRGVLLRAVRTADPAGRYAMAVATVPTLVGGDPPMLAVDSGRLAAVAIWGEGPGGLSAAQAATALRPTAPEPVTLRTDALGLDITATGVDPSLRLGLTAHLAPLDGNGERTINLGELVTGRHRYSGAASGCLEGCRLVGIEVTQPAGSGFNLDLVVHALYQGNPATPVDVGLTAPGRWRGPAETTKGAAPVVTPGPDGLTVKLTDRGLGVDPWIVPVDAPYPLPVVASGRLGRDTLGGLDVNPQPVKPVGAVTVLPHLGLRGVLVDFEYADRDARYPSDAVDPQVWLAADAPADLADRLHEAGLTVLDRRTDTARVRYLDRQGPASGLRFHLLAGVLAVILALGGLILIATVDRRGAGQLRGLREQGVPRAALWAADRYGYAGLVVAALLLGPIAAAAAWIVTGRSIPLFADGIQIVPPSPLPGWPLLIGAWAATALLLMGTAVVASRLVSAGSDERRGHG